MSANTKIEWAHHTFNPWIGCTKVGPGCDNCYAEADFATRRKVVQWGAGQPRKHTAPSTWAQPVRWNAEAQRLGVRYRVFCASLADVFDNEVPDVWRLDLFKLIAATPNLDWLILTKRIGNVSKMLGDYTTVPLLSNIWLGITVVTQAEADRDIPKLLAVPAARRLLSMEPLLGPVDLTSIDVMGGDGVIFPLKVTTDCVNDEGEPGDDIPALDWIIVGGESGPNARPMHPDWARSIKQQCASSGVPFFMKQMGGVRDKRGDLEDLPEDLSVREFPHG